MAWPPGSSGPVPGPLPRPQLRNGGGQYVLAAAGTLLHDGVALPRLSCAYVSSEEPPFSLRAGADGLEALIMQFPVAEAYRPNDGRA